MEMLLLLMTNEDPTVTIVDGYVDEPAHFGVPPYISTYPRYTAGALVDAGIPEKKIKYHTIDELREDRGRWQDIASATLVVYIGGMTVPGKYVGGTPATPEEVKEIAWTADGTSIMGGPSRFGVGEENVGGVEAERTDMDFDHVAMGDIEAIVYDFVASGFEELTNRYRKMEEANQWAQQGAFVLEQHPNDTDYLICELETGRGCAYRCSFCTEPLYGDPTFRPPETIVDEVQALANHGAVHFRLGRQADILAYGGDGEQPNPDAIEQLYSGIRDAVPALETLHLDNMNPKTIVDYPEPAKEAISTIAKYNTPGDTAAFGLESADPVVQEQNNLVISADECFEAVKILNEVGGWRPDDWRLPKLLPGINFVHGLAGERSETFEHNEEFLNRIYDAGLMVRRVNIRKVMAFPGTEMEETGTAVLEEHEQKYQAYKRRVRETIDNPMLQRVAPAGTILPNVRFEYHEDGKTFGRQPGTYSLLVGLPGEYELDVFQDVVVVDHGYRSITAVPYPLDVNTASMDELTAIDGIGKQRAGDIIVNRPYRTLDDVPVDIDLSSFVTVPDTTKVTNQPK